MEKDKVLPAGWETWTHSQQVTFLKNQKKRVKDLARMRLMIEKFAKQESFQPKPLKLQKPMAETMWIRVVYGPVMGFRSSSIVIMDKKKRPVGHKFLDCGPRAMLWGVFQTVAELGGNAVIDFVHNGQVMEVDPEAFEQWIKQAHQDPVSALIDPLRLLERKDDK